MREKAFAERTFLSFFIKIIRNYPLHFVARNQPSKKNLRKIAIFSVQL